MHGPCERLFLGWSDRPFGILHHGQAALPAVDLEMCRDFRRYERCHRRGEATTQRIEIRRRIDLPHEVQQRPKLATVQTAHGWKHVLTIRAGGKHSQAPKGAKMRTLDSGPPKPRTRRSMPSAARVAIMVGGVRMKLRLLGIASTCSVDRGNTRRTLDRVCE